jgi:hypothetical protein
MVGNNRRLAAEDAARYILNSCEAAIELTLQSLDAGCR